jgi:hypothetical protein
MRQLLILSQCSLKVWELKFTPPLGFGTDIEMGLSFSGGEPSKVMSPAEIFGRAFSVIRFENANDLIRSAPLSTIAASKPGKSGLEVSAALYRANSTLMTGPFCHWTLQRRPRSVRSNLRSNTGLMN